MENELEPEVQNEYVKIDDNTVKIIITKTVTEEVFVNIGNLEYDRDSLVRTMQANTDEANEKNEKIQMQIDAIDDKLKEVKKLGVKRVARLDENGEEEIEKPAKASKKKIK